MPYRDAPEAVVKRLPIYLRILDKLMEKGEDMVSSLELSQETGFSAEQIRKDLTIFGAFGTRGAGYQVDLLRDKLVRIIGLHGQTRVILVGAGQLGTALARYTMTKNNYVELVGIFDNNPEIVGRDIFGKRIMDVSELPRLVSSQDVKVAMVTVPGKEAQEVVNYLVENGIKAIQNFAPVNIKVPEGVRLQNMDFTLELQSLIFYISSWGEESQSQKGKTKEDDETVPSV